VSGCPKVSVTSSILFSIIFGRFFVMDCSPLPLEQVTNMERETPWPFFLCLPLFSQFFVTWAFTPCDGSECPVTHKKAPPTLDWRGFPHCASDWLGPRNLMCGYWISSLILFIQDEQRVICGFLWVNEVRRTKSHKTDTRITI